MKWRRGVGAGQIEDRRGMRSGGLGMPIGVGGGGLGLVGLIVVLLLNGVLGGGGGGGASIDPRLDPFPGMPPAASGAPAPGATAGDENVKQFVSFVVNDVQQSWAREFQRGGQTYEKTTLVLFDEATSSGCGPASAETGPFYCPADRRVYLDLGFFRELTNRFGAPGDFAQAYVIAHEFGHHVQNLTGVSDQVDRARRANPDESNDLSVRLELQADCFAGIWGHSAYEQKLLESGDLEEGLAAAAAVGDDRLQRQSTGRVDRDSFTHGSSEQRVRWFKTGFESGDPNRCDTFSGDV